MACPGRPWWAAACLPLAAALNLNPGSSPLWALVMLLPLIPFLFLAVKEPELRVHHTIQPPFHQAAATLFIDSPSARRRENGDRRQSWWSTMNVHRSNQWSISR